MSIKLNKVLISDPVDPAAIEILRQRNLQVDVRTGLPKDQLISISIIPVSVIVCWVWHFVIIVAF